MSLIDSPAFHLSHSSFLRTADNPGRPGLAMPIPPIRPTQKTLPCCTDRLNLPGIFFRNAVAQSEYRAAVTGELQAILFVPVNTASDKNHPFAALTRKNDSV